MCACNLLHALFPNRTLISINMDQQEFIKQRQGVNRCSEALTTFCHKAEQHDMASLWVSDHVVFPTVGNANYPSGRFPHAPHTPYLEPVAVLAAAAMCTERARLGSSVFILGHRNSVVMAKMLTTIDTLSHGRLICGSAPYRQALRRWLERSPDPDQESSADTRPTPHSIGGFPDRVPPLGSPRRSPIATAAGVHRPRPPLPAAPQRCVFRALLLNAIESGKIKARSGELQP